MYVYAAVQVFRDTTQRHVSEEQVPRLHRYDKLKTRLYNRLYAKVSGLF
jgi:hypothetical protein